MHAVGGQEGLFIGNMQECQAWVVKMFITVTYKNAHLARNLSIIAFFGQKRISMIVAKGSHCVETTKPQAFWDCNSSIEGNMNQHCVSIEGALRCADKMAPCIAGCAWFDRELQVLQEEGQLFGEWREPSFLLRGASGLPTYITP